MAMRGLVAGGVLLLTLAGPANALDATLTAEIGARLFKRAWVPAPASTKANDGLGPHFDARSCAACHPGGGRAPGGAELAGYSIRLDRDGAPDPRFGRFLQSQATAGVAAEGLVRRVENGFEIVEGAARGALQADTRIFARLAPDLTGVAAFERIDPRAILARADPDDRDQDGISGRAPVVGIDANGPVLGLYGWKASHARLSDQIEAAFAFDMGLSTVGFPDPYGDCTPVQADCRGAPRGASDAEPEIAPAIVAALSAYLVTRAAPSLPEDPTGAALFAATGCATCHVPTLPLKDGGAARVFTDLLLHDMGDALIGDAEPNAGAREWRTAPLIGLGTVARRGGGFLHDGRAPTLHDAILAHGGEATDARARYTGLRATDRSALIAYLEKL